MDVQGAKPLKEYLKNGVLDQAYKRKVGEDVRDTLKGLKVGWTDRIFVRTNDKVEEQRIHRYDVAHKNCGCNDEVDHLSVVAVIELKINTVEDQEHERKLKREAYELENMPRHKVPRALEESSNELTPALA